MRNITAEFFRSLCILFLFLSSVQPAYAHGDEPRLEISVERINPGGIIDIRGVGFELEELVSLTLMGDGFEFPLGEIIADEEGVFMHTVSLPVDLAEGEYYFRAITDDHQIASPALTVFGAPILNEGGEPLRDEDDGLLAPMPTFAPGVAPTVVSQPAVQTSSEEQPAATESWAILVLAILFGLAIFLAARFRAAGRVM